MVNGILLFLYSVACGFYKATEIYLSDGFVVVINLFFFLGTVQHLTDQVVQEVTPYSVNELSILSKKYEPSILLEQHIFEGIKQLSLFQTN